jgi:hypothetical protein
MPMCWLRSRGHEKFSALNLLTAASTLGESADLSVCVGR